MIPPPMSAACIGVSVSQASPPSPHAPFRPAACTSTAATAPQAIAGAIATAQPRAPQPADERHVRPACPAAASISRLNAAISCRADRAVDRAVIEAAGGGHHRGDGRAHRPPHGAACRPRRPPGSYAWGGLITASNCLIPYMPRFEIDAVPPLYSSGASLPSLARVRRGPSISVAIRESRLLASRASTMIGVISPPGIDDRHRDVGALANLTSVVACRTCTLAARAPRPAPPPAP